MDQSDKRTNRPKARQSIAHMPSLSRSTNADQQNATIDVSATRRAQDSSIQASKKRTRGKSLGPGGLEALQEISGNATKDVSLFQPRSILKPTIPLTPPKVIPTFDELRQRSTRKKSPARNGTEALLIDFSTPGPNHNGSTQSNLQSASDPFDPFSPVKAAQIANLNRQSRLDVEEAEEDRLRQEQKKKALEQRAARRKSMANRRVSFAPEATLHTWSVMETVEDSTTSSASNSTRRQSSMTAQQSPPRAAQSPLAGLTAPGVSSIPDMHSEEPLIRASPARQNSSNQRKRRRSSTVSETGDISGDELYSSSPLGDVATESSPIRVEDSIHSDSDTDGDTAMSMDEITQNTIQSQASNSSTQSSLEERLQQAASQAGTRGIEYDEYGDDVSMDLANDTVTNAYLPWKGIPEQRQDPLEDQEDVRGFSPSRKARQLHAEEPNEEEITQGMTMDITQAVGRIIGSDTAGNKARRKSVISRHRSSVGRRQSVAADSSYGDETMDLTSVAGGIVYMESNSDHDGDINSGEDMTMEFTTVIGGVQHLSRQDLTESTISDENDFMDMTAAVGGILAPIDEQTEPQTDIEDEKAIPMEMTKAVGQILSSESMHNSTNKDSMLGLDNTPKGVHVSSESFVHGIKDIVVGTPQQLTSVASETGSPSLARKTRSSGRTKTLQVNQASTPKSSTKNTRQSLSLGNNQTTPTKQLTPLPTKSRTPERTPLSFNVTHRGASPKKLFQAEIQAKSSPASIRQSVGKQQDPLFAQDEATGRHTPRVVLHAPKPHQHLRRRSSGIGIDKEGFGSPSITQLLSRRSSIGDAAPKFTLEPSQGTKIRRVDPRQLEEELDAERAKDERRESGRFIMEQEANEQHEENVTAQLKDMIESMTPKKTKVNKAKGRKSLAVGSARGLLGKRPMELDNEDEDEDGSNTPKRLKAVSKEESPVKKIYLPKPPSKEETTGRLTRAEQKAVEPALDSNQTPTLGGTPSRIDHVGSPQHIHRFKDMAQISVDERPTSFENKLDNVLSAIDPSIEHPSANRAIADEDKISLQQFLNMTNIHFIELNTTKRRHTLAQASSDITQEDGEAQSSSIKACFIAATTTMPLLELYQHATKELKSYISTGRKIIRSIESETFAEQPALFREYIDARPDIKLVMDNQFRNGKTNARLQSKEGWYMWRSQLVDGLGAGLRSIRNDMGKDFSIVDEQVGALAIALPELVQHRDSLVNDKSNYQQRLHDIGSMDHQALRATREDLNSVDIDLQGKLIMLKALKYQMHDKEEALSQATELKDEMQDQIAEANKVREEHQGWVVQDVLALKGKVNMIEKQFGWTLTSAEEDPESTDEFGPALTMKYRDTLRLFFYPEVFEQPTSMRRRSSRTTRTLPGPTAPISLTFLPNHEDKARKPNLPTEQRFFLQLIQSQLHAFSVMPKGEIAAKTVLDTVSSGWQKACQISEELRLLGMTGIARVSIKSDECLSVRLLLMLPENSRVDVEFVLLATVSSSGEISLSTSVAASPVYGLATSILDVSKTRKVQNALNTEVESKIIGTGTWVNAVQGFENWYSGQAVKRRQQLQDRPEKTQAVEAAPADVVPAGSTTPKSPAPAPSKTPASRRSPLALKRYTVIQKKIPVPTARQEKFRTSQREVQVQVEKPQPAVQELGKDKENVDPFVQTPGFKPPAITPEMQEAMMQRTPIKRVGALRRSPIH